MKKIFKNNSLVILAKEHSPSILTDSFLIKSGICEDLINLKADQNILTSHFSQIVFENGLTIILDPNRFAVTSDLSDEPFVIGQKYCKAVNLLVGYAVGINFDVEIGEYDVQGWFHKLSKNGNECVEIKYKSGNCNITLKRINNTSALVNFNFHYDLIETETLGDIKLNFVEEWTKNNVIVNTFLDSNF